MKRLLYKLAFWFLTLSWVGGCKDDIEASTPLYGVLCNTIDCGEGYVCVENVFPLSSGCYPTCQTDEDCVEANPSFLIGNAPTCETWICDTDGGYCSTACGRCFEDIHCEEGQACVHHRCEPVGSGADGDEEVAEDVDSDGDEEAENVDSDGDEDRTEEDNEYSTEDGDADLDAAEDTEGETDDAPNR